MQKGYFKAAWNDIKQSEGWLGKMFLLGLLSLIPIFGQVVLFGYACIHYTKGIERSFASVHRA